MRLLVIAIGPMDVNDARKNPVVVETWTLGDVGLDLWQHGLNVRTRTFLRRKTPLKYSRILEHLRRGQLRTRLRDIFMGSSIGRKQATVDLEASTTKTASIDTLGGQGAGTAQRLSEVPPPTNPATLRNFSVGQQQFNALRNLVTNMRTAHVQVVVVHTPVSDWFAQVYSETLWHDYMVFLNRVSAELAVPVMLLPMAAYGLTDEDYFHRKGRFDGHHVLSENGRTAFAKGLLRHVIQPAHDRLKAGLKVDASMSRFEVEGQ